jgi:nucleoside-diphosphate-sugar epimerase
LAGQRVLVTGASGFIGSHLCERLVEAGAEVHGLSRQPRIGGTVSMRWWTGDVAAVETVRAVFREVRPQTIYHMASHVMGAPALDHVLPTFHGNLESTVNLLTAAAETGCSRLVLTGSLAEPEPLRGEAFPSSPYAAAKWASSAYARMFHALYGVPAVIARVFMVYGPAQTDLSKLIPSVILSLLKGESPAITSGDRLVDWIFVSDVIDAYLTLAAAEGVEGTTVEIGSGVLVSIREIVTRLSDLVGVGIQPSFGVLPDRPFEPVRVADVTVTRTRIGWAPKTSLETGLSRTVDWYREHFDELMNQDPDRLWSVRGGERSPRGTP